MADEDRVEQFPDVVQKLSAPKKLSKFEQEKKDADAKRRKEEEENAAALREFEESFAHDEDDDDVTQIGHDEPKNDDPDVDARCRRPGHQSGPSALEGTRLLGDGVDMSGHGGDSS